MCWVASRQLLNEHGAGYKYIQARYQSPPALHIGLQREDNDTIMIHMVVYIHRGSQGDPKPQGFKENMAMA